MLENLRLTLTDYRKRLDNTSDEVCCIVCYRNCLKKVFRVHTDLEKSWKFTLVLENSWNSKKVQFVLQFSWNFKKNLLDYKNSFKNDRNSDSHGFFGCSAQKNQENGKISNRKRSVALYSDSVGDSDDIYHYRHNILFYSSSTNQTQREVKLAKQTSRKAKRK